MISLLTSTCSSWGIEEVGGGGGVEGLWGLFVRNNTVTTSTNNKGFDSLQQRSTRQDSQAQHSSRGPERYVLEVRSRPTLLQHSACSDKQYMQRGRLSAPLHCSSPPLSYCGADTVKFMQAGKKKKSGSNRPRK